MAFVLLSTSRRKDRISETSEACSVGVNLLGSSGDKVCSYATSSKSLRPSCRKFWFGGEGGDDDRPGEESPRESIDEALRGIVEDVWNTFAGEAWVTVSVAITSTSLNEHRMFQDSHRPERYVRAHSY
jgi:hypothetical protein